MPEIGAEGEDLLPRRPKGEEMPGQHVSEYMRRMGLKTSGRECVTDNGELAIFDADQRQVEFIGDEFLQLARKQRFVPSPEFGQLVVGDAVGTTLRFGQMEPSGKSLKGAFLWKFSCYINA